LGGRRTEEFDVATILDSMECAVMASTDTGTPCIANTSSPLLPVLGPVLGPREEGMDVALLLRPRQAMFFSEASSAGFEDGYLTPPEFLSLNDLSPEGRMRRFSEPSEAMREISAPTLKPSSRRRSEPSWKRKDRVNRLAASSACSASARRCYKLPSFVRGDFTPAGSEASFAFKGSGRSRTFNSDISSPPESCFGSPVHSFVGGTSAAATGSSAMPKRPQLLSATWTPAAHSDVSRASASKSQSCPKEGQSWCTHETSGVANRLSRFRVADYAMDLDGQVFEFFKSAVLRSCLCTSLRDGGVSELAQQVELFVFRDGEEMVRRGESGTHFFIVKDGQCFAIPEDGKCIVLDPGSCFGEAPLLHGSGQFMTVTARGGSCSCWGVPRRAFRRSLMNMARSIFRENIALMERAPVFRYLSQRQKAMLCKTCMVHHYPAGGVVVREGTPHCGTLFLVRSGSLEVTVAGLRRVRLYPGDHFGELALLHQQPRSATVVALEHTTLCAMQEHYLDRISGVELQDVLWRHALGIMLRHLKIPLLTDAPMVTDAFVIRDLPPEPWEAPGLRLVVVLKGQAIINWMPEQGSDGGEPRECRLERGQWSGEENLLRQDCSVRCSIQRASTAPCKLALLFSDAALSLTAPMAEDILDHRERMALVKGVYALRHLSTRQHALLAASFRAVTMRRGVTVILEGDLGSQFFIIRLGEVLVSKRVLPASSRNIRTLGRSDYFGERGLLYGEPRSASVTCVSEVVELMVIDKAVFLHIMEEKMLHYLEERIRLQQTDVALADLCMGKVLGSGTYGVVRLVQHKIRGTQYALKCISRTEAAKYAQQENLRLEREILLENDHPFIIKVVRTFKDNSHLYFLTELVAGGELYEVIRAIGLLSRPQAQFYVGSLMLAIESLHERRIAYRDLKPENVLVDSQGFTKLIDFGCAVKLKGSSCTMVGTPHYMAPEVILGTGYRTTCDVWSMGVCLFEFMCGPLPFGNILDDPMQVFREILVAKLVIPPAMKDDPGKSLIRRLLRRPLEFRIGCGKSAWKAVRRHSFFHGFSFDALLSRKLEPPFLPSALALEDGAPLNEDEARSDSSALSDVNSEVPTDSDWDKDF